MSVRQLSSADDYLHEVGPELSWNESRYLDFHDRYSGVCGWLRIGMRPNEGHSEMSVCVHLPDGRCAFYYARVPIEGNLLSTGGQEWTIGDPYRSCAVRYHGPVLILEDPWDLVEPKRAYATAPRAVATIELRVATAGADAVLGADQEHIDKIFLPGQADWHYQHLCWVTGTVTVADETLSVNGRGGKDHSWGPRNWLAKVYLRWLTAVSDDDEFGFMLVRAVGPTKRTRSGHVWEKGVFHLVDDVTMTNSYERAAPYRLLRTEVTLRAGQREWMAVGSCEQWLPLRHSSADEHGNPALLRIVKSPTRWTFGDGRTGAGMSEIHDRIGADGIPAGIED